MSVFKECDTPQVLDSHNTTATEGSCTNEPSNEPQKLCVDEVQSGSDMDSSSVVSDNSTLAKAENIDNSRISCKSSLKRIWPWLLGAAVAIATILVFVLTQKSPVEKLNEYIQNNGEPFEGGYRLVSKENIEKGQTSLISYGNGSYVFAWDMDNSIMENSFRLKVEPKSKMASFEIKENITLVVGFRGASDSVTATGTIEKTKNISSSDVNFETYRPFTIQLFTAGDVSYYNEEMVKDDVKSTINSMLKNINDMLELSGTGATLADFGFTS